MKIALSVDALAPSLTGIGRYTWELVKGLQQHSAVDELGFYRHGRAVADPAVYLAENGKAPSYWPGQKWWQRRCYRQLVGSSFCHGTNYFLPPEAETGVITVHDLSVFKYPETHPIERIREFEKLLPASIEKACHVITDSEAVRQEVIDWFSLDSSKVTAIHLGVDPAFKPAHPAQSWHYLEKLALKAGNYSLCVSTLEPRKRISELLNAYRLLPHSLRQQCPLVLAGTQGWENELLLVQIRLAQAEGWLIYPGFVSESTLVELYQGAKLFIYPSLYEGFGLPVAEAMACGVPVLSSDCVCLKEIGRGISNEVDISNQAEFVQNLLSLLDASDSNIASSDIKPNTYRYDWGSCVQETIDIYSNCRVLR